MTDVRTTGGGRLSLTDKQAEVFQLLNSGQEVGDVAKALNVSNGAIYSHIKRIREKHPDVLIEWAHLGTGGRGEVRPPAPAPAPASTAGNGSGFTPPADDDAQRRTFQDAIASMGEPSKTAVQRALDVVNGQREAVETRIAEIDAEVAEVTAAYQERTEALSSEKTELEAQRAQLSAMAGASVPTE